MKVWDVRKPNEHVRSLQVCDYIDKKLCDLYEAESVFDKFTLTNSPCGRFLMTGAYNNNAHIIDKECYANTTLYGGFEQKKGRPCGQLRVYGGKRLKPLDGKPDLRRRVGICVWHPTESIIACAN